MIEDVTSKTPSLELVPPDQRDDAAPAPHPLGDIALPTFVAAGTGAEKDVTSVDKYLTAATSEFEDGDIDQPLWDHALAQAKGERETAISCYLRARATALRGQKRDLSTERCVRAPRVTGVASSESPGPGNTGRNQPSHAERRGAKSNAHYGTAVVATCAGIVWCVLLVYVYFGRSAPQEPAVSAIVAPVKRSNPSERGQ